MGDTTDDMEAYSGLAEDYLHSRHKGSLMVRVSKDRPTVKKKARKKTSSSSPAPSSSDDFLLPDAPNEPPQTLWESITMLHGEKGVGKTTLLAQIPNSLVFQLERRRRNLKIFQRPIANWEEMKMGVDKFLSHDRYNYAVIDTIDNAYMYCLKAVCERNNIANPDESGSYMIWDEIAEEFGALLLMVAESGKGLGFISHTKARPMTQKRKGLNRDEADQSVVEYQRLEPTCKPAAFRLIQEIADFVFYYGYKDGSRAMTVRSPYNIHWVSCGIGDDHFLDPKGNQIETFKVPNTPKGAYQALLDAYDNKLYDMDYLPSQEEAPPRRRKKRRKKSS